MFEKLKAHQEKVMAQEKSFMCKHKSVFFQSISLSVEEVEQKGKNCNKTSQNVTNRHELLLILERKVIFIHVGYLPEAESDRV